MKLLEVKVLRGPNYWSIRKQKLIQMLLDLEDLEFRPTNEIPGFYEGIKALMPSLYNHYCSEGHPGGFFERVKDGTWMGHVIEHLALELQTLAGMSTGFGRTRGAGKEGVYFVVFSYCEEEEGLYTAGAALRLAEALIRGEAFDIAKEVDTIKSLWHKEKLGPSTHSITAEALRRDIPVIRLDASSTVQLGYGSKQKRIDAAMTSYTGIIGVEIAGNKEVTKKVLAEALVPVPAGRILTCVDQLKAAIEEVGFPLVIKPLNANQGKGATTHLTTWQDATAAFVRAKEFSEEVIVEKFITGNDFRALVVNYKFVAAALRTPAAVTGDGLHTIAQLIDRVNADPRRGQGHENSLTAIRVDEVTWELLAKKNYRLDTVLPKDRVLHLKPTANLSTGGTATDVTDTVHPANIRLFERIAHLIGLDVCGIDVMAANLSEPIKQSGGAVIEVNAAPGLRMHLQPSAGQPRNVAAPIIDMLFPTNDGRIPIVAITGTNGKTTTTRLLAHIVQHEGYCTGYTTTDGIYINGEQLNDGDAAGPASGRLILRDHSVEFAVLECARGGMLRSGLPFDKCDCAIVTNVASDHLGMGGIHTIEQLAKVKAIVPESVKETGYAVLNADDDRVYAMKDRVHCKVALFSLFPDNARIEQHCAEGGLAAFVDDG
ncbi:cyanophycin synthetase [Paraflavisolibacter sp. H34]|uniref:cyanophycin synthetase n=1 Tax=Huijunlia imazamoxiresistens TaxID=3127457 RepID=UPI003019EEC3